MSFSSQKLCSKSCGLRDLNRFGDNLGLRDLDLFLRDSLLLVCLVRESPEPLRSRFLVKQSSATVTSMSASCSAIKIQHWNKGPAHLVNKHHDIEALISEHRPQVLGISEANLHSGHNLRDVQQDDYDLHISTTINNPQLKVARVVVKGVV